MGKAPVLKPREVVALLGKAGFVEVRQRGSHQQFAMPTDGAPPCRFTRAAIFAPTLLRQIAKDIGLSVDEFVTGEPSQPPDTLQPTAVEPPVPKQPSEPGRD